MVKYGKCAGIVTIGECPKCHSKDSLCYDAEAWTKEPKLFCVECQSVWLEGQKEEKNCAEGLLIGEQFDNLLHRK